MAAANKSTAAVPLSKDALLKSYRKRLRDDIGSMTSNFMEIIKLCRVEEETQVSRATQCEEDAFEMQVRAANMVNFTTFPSVNCTILRKCSPLGQGWRVSDEAHQ